MSAAFLLYGSTGFVGSYVARLALRKGFTPIIAGRNRAAVEKQAGELGVEYRAFELDDTAALDRALAGVPVVLHCAGPYIHTYKPVVEACLRSGTHYLDITGEMPVYRAIAALDSEAKSRGVMLMPGVGFDVVPTDCLALYLKQRLPSATHLALAFQSIGPAAIPPGTAKTMVETLSRRSYIRRDGRLVPFPSEPTTRDIDFGDGPKKAILFAWGDVFTAYYSTGIPNIEDYGVLPPGTRRMLKRAALVRPLFRFAAVRSYIRSKIPAGSTEAERARTRTNVWGEVTDDRGGKAVARLHGPEAGVVWTAEAALAVLSHALSGNAPLGYQTPARAYGPDLVMQCSGVTREDVSGA